MMPHSLRRKFSLALIGFGISFLTIAFFIEKFGLSVGTIRVQIMLGFLGTMLVLGGALERRFALAYRGLAVIGLNSIVLMICLELAATAVNQLAREPSTDGAQTLFVPPDGDLELIFEEVREAKFDRNLYVGWMNKPYSGQTLAISSDGLRQTPGAACESDALRIFAFGGSTMWGEGASNEGTIPAYLQSMLAPRLDRPLCVTNYAQRAWVSTQSLVKLIIELQKKNFPDVVIFYDGYNDVYAGYATGRVGVPENFYQMSESDEESRGGKRQLIQLVQKTELGKLAMRFATKPSDNPRSIDPIQMSESIVDAYQHVRKITESLADTYGFAFKFYWQPQLAAGTKPLSDGERTMLESHPWLPEMVRNLTDATYARIEQAAATDDDLIDLSDVFAEVSDQIYIDPAHITSSGNQIVAQAMLEFGLREIVMIKASEHISSKTQTPSRDD